MSLLPIQEKIGSRKHKEIYELVRRQGTVSKIELLEQTQMTGSTLTRTLEELTHQGWLVEAGFGESTGGRRPILYQTNPTAAYVFGLDISRMSSKLILCDLHMNKLDAESWLMDERMTPDRLLRDIADAAERMLHKHRIAADAVLGMGIGAVGPLDRTTGIILEPLYFPAAGWRHVEVARYMQERLRIPVLLDNGANTAIIGESWSDRNRDYRHLLYVHLGVGIRSSMMAGGKVVYGAVDMEGSIGQMIIQTDGPRIGNHGNFGSLQTYASIHALEQQAQSRLKQGRESSLRYKEADPEKINYTHLLQGLKEHDPLTVEIFSQAATYFGIGLSNLLNILHPEKVILGGSLISSDPSFFQIATRVAIRNTYYYPAYQVVFSQGHLGEEALVTGAAIMMINQLTEL
ncbi:ROK family transcriptional regulator [Paenibacillus doosanensis]|uniref:ROK family transcriptional regulator n=1 Tax=Paenibacillus doosanensis TaxID=1229154 RepID=UPI00217FB222|nr:ROK family transcriptional regulator [Paenibacillus doosanensis]MCS7458775.1 ROK family transcriptional regulator [Paenibacillus doosanensis]